MRSRADSRPATAASTQRRAASPSSTSIARLSVIGGRRLPISAEPGARLLLAGCPGEPGLPFRPNLRRHRWLPTATSAARGRASATASRTRTAGRPAAGTRTSSACARWWARRASGSAFERAERDDVTERLGNLARRVDVDLLQHLDADGTTPPGAELADEGSGTPVPLTGGAVIGVEQDVGVDERQAFLSVHACPPATR